MSRHIVAVDGKQFIVAGSDPPMGTWYAQLYNEGDSTHDAPRAVIGYTEDEVALTLAERPDAKIGPYPVRSASELVALIRSEWGYHVSVVSVTP